MKIFYIVKGEYPGDGGSKDPFYSTIFTLDEFNEAGLSQERKNRFTEVIEKSAYDDFQSKLDKAIKALEYYSFDNDEIGAKARQVLKEIEGE